MPGPFARLAGGSERNEIIQWDRRGRSPALEIRSGPCQLLQMLCPESTALQPGLRIIGKGPIGCIDRHHTGAKKAPGCAADCGAAKVAVMSRKDFRKRD
jgi:hypothetical protein